ncbi:MAG: PTS sugar transporter subunit IIA [Arhodomonas sp.]|nr:PTS sugar transporter subunit IIA [Arhodomonas sp.]
MSVGLLIVTHNRIGQELLHTANTILGTCPLYTRHLDVPQDSSLEAMVRRGMRMVQELDAGDGVLILTDAFGATPSNVAVQLGDRIGTAVVSGVNLPMLLRVLNYPELPLTALRDKAYTGGRDGVLLVEPTPKDRTGGDERH